jgi:hypothetical protein
MLGKLFTLRQSPCQPVSRAFRRTASGKISFQNIIATIYRVLGIDREATLPDYNGRPMYLLDDREPIAELF